MLNSNNFVGKLQQTIGNQGKSLLDYWIGIQSESSWPKQIIFKERGMLEPNEMRYLDSTGWWRATIASCRTIQNDVIRFRMHG